MSFLVFEKMVFGGLIKSGLKKGAKIGMGVGKVALKKGKQAGFAAAKTGGKIALNTAKTGGKLALQHGNSLVDAGIRGTGVVATGLVGNPAPLFGAEAAIMGKDYLASAGAKKLREAITNRKKKSLNPKLSTSKSLQYYPKPPPKKSTPRTQKHLGISSTSHGYKAYSSLVRRGLVNTSSAAGRNRDFFSSATRPTGAKI